MRNFGKQSYQHNKKFVNWIKSYPKNFFKLALQKNKILGCVHGFDAPVKVGNKVDFFINLHDLMVDKAHRSRLGIKLIKDGLLQNKPVILSGSAGKVSALYKALGAKKFNSHWYKKSIIPNILFSFLSFDSNRVLSAQKKSGAKIVNNKSADSRKIIKDILIKYNYDNSAKEFLNWRFLHDNAPLTFFASNADDVILFTLARRRYVPFIRIFSVKKVNNNNFFNLLKGIERFASHMGVVFILYTITEDVPPPKSLKYIKYKKEPDFLIFSNSQVDLSQVTVNGFSTDQGFESHIV